MEDLPGNEMWKAGSWGGSGSCSGDTDVDKTLPCRHSVSSTPWEGAHPNQALLEWASHFQNICQQICIYNNVINWIAQRLLIKNIYNRICSKITSPKFLWCHQQPISAERNRLWISFWSPAQLDQMSQGPSRVALRGRGPTSARNAPRGLCIEPGCPIWPQCQVFSGEWWAIMESFPLAAPACTCPPMGAWGRGHPGKDKAGPKSPAIVLATLAWNSRPHSGSFKKKAMCCSLSERQHGAQHLSIPFDTSRPGCKAVSTSH